MDASISLDRTFELLLKDERELDRRITDAREVSGEVRRLIAISLGGLILHGAVVGLAGASLGAAPLSAIAWMPLIFTGACMGALAICLPSFYFYTQLAGVDASLAIVTAQALRAQATTSVYLFAAVPFYTALALASALHLFGSGTAVLGAGVLLPFVVGLFGVRSTYRGFGWLAEVLPRTHLRGGNYLRRLVMAWAVVFTAIAPIALQRLGEAFGFDAWAAAAEVLRAVGRYW